MNIDSKKIPCFVLVYYDFNIIKKSIDFLLKYGDKLDLIVVENKSDFTATHIFPYLISLVHSNLISKYILFENNISNNACEVVFDCENVELNHKFVIITDGDLVPENPDWLQEQIQILESHSDVFACAISLDEKNLPLRAMPESVHWVDPGIDCGDYILGETGAALLLFRTLDFQNFLRFRRNHPMLKFRDAVMRDYCKRVLKKKWARTKKSLAYHLTWDNYADLSNSYTASKLQHSHEEIWTHYRYSPYTVYTLTMISMHYPWFKMLLGPLYRSIHSLQKVIATNRFVRFFNSRYKSLLQRNKLT